MASPSHSPSHSSPPPPPTLTTINSLTDDLLREIFVRLPSLPSLVCAACTCRAFLRAVRSSPAFRRRFRELHAPPLLALFRLRLRHRHAFVPAARRSPDPDIAAAFEDSFRDDGASEWGTNSLPYFSGNFLFVNRNTEQSAFYNPHTLVLSVFSKKPNTGFICTFLEFHTLPADQGDQRLSRVVCVHRNCSWASVRVAVFSSHTKEWRTFAESGALLLESATRTDVSGSLFWIHEREHCIIALNTATFQFSRMDVPQSLRSPFSRYVLGHTNDGRLCIVHAEKCTISVWIWTADDDGVEKFMMHKMLPLHTIVTEITKHSIQDFVVVGNLMTVIDGFVYLSVLYPRDRRSSEWILSLCLETADVNLLFKKRRRFGCHLDPYIMSWPPSLILHIKEDSETQVTGDDGRVATEEASPILFTALQSFKEALIDDDNTKFVEMDAFLLDDEINSLQKRITSLDAGLAAARDRVLRSGAHSDFYREGMERESWWQMRKGMLRRASSCFFPR